MEILKGRVYRAKNPAHVDGFFNDRQVLYVTDYSVQYDGPAVGRGRKYPMVSREKFEAWAATDVSDSLPEGEWAPWAPPARAAKKAAPAPVVAQQAA